MSRTIAIVGGGLAGIAAAVRLAEAGEHPVILESSRRLGGRATSFVDPRSGEVLDNCQHVVMGCCTNIIDLYERIGVLDLITWHRDLYWAVPGGEPDRVAAGRLPAPAHLARAFASMRRFDRAEKRAIRHAMISIVRLGARGRLRWTDRTFAEFLSACEQPASVVAGFWNVVITSACNLDVDRVGAGFALHVVQHGFLANRWSYTMGLASVPLVELYDPAADLIRERGGEVRFGATAKGIAYDGTRVTGVVTTNDTIRAAAVITALPPERLDRLASDTLRRADARLRRLGELDTSPILGVHLRFETAVMDVPHLILEGTGAHWLFDKGTRDDGSQHLHAVISAADEWMELDEAEIVRRVTADIHRALPRSVGLEPVAARAVKEKRATFAARPGVDASRPSTCPEHADGGVDNLFIAGDWTDTGWPATMEGAVRSGYEAAAAITGQGGVAGDVPPGLLARILGLE